MSGFIKAHLSVFNTKMGSRGNSKLLKFLYVVHGYICRDFLSFWRPIFKRKKRSDKSNEVNFSGQEDSDDPSE